MHNSMLERSKSRLTVASCLAHCAISNPCPDNSDRQIVILARWGYCSRTASRERGRTASIQEASGPQRVSSLIVDGNTWYTNCSTVPWRLGCVQTLYSACRAMSLTLRISRREKIAQRRNAFFKIVIVPELNGSLEDDLANRALNALQGPSSIQR